MRGSGLCEDLFHQPRCPAPHLFSFEKRGSWLCSRFNVRAIVLRLPCRYFESLLQLKGRSREAGAEFLSWNDIQDSVSNTNSSVQDENDRESCPRGVGSSRGSPRLSRREVAQGPQP